MRVAKTDSESAKNRASALAIDTAVWYRQQLSSASSSVVLMGAMVVHARGRYTAVRELFAGLAPALMSQTAVNTTKMLEYVPNGVVRDIYPLTGNNAGAAGFNLFTAPGDRDGAVATVRDGAMTLVGPMKFFEGGYGVIVRVPVFVPGVDANETFGLPDPLDSYCGAPCAYNATTRTAFWGFSAGLVDLEAINAMPDSKPRMLQSMGYRYQIRALGIAEAELRVVAASERPPVDPVEAVISLPNTQWVVLVAPEDGWTNSSYAGLVAGVVVVAVVVAVLLFAALYSRRRHQMLLEALLPKQVLRHLHSSDPSLSRIGNRILNAETTADMLLGLLGQLLENQMPSLRDVVYCRQAIIRRTEIYEPIALGQHIRNANLDRDVARNLMHLMGRADDSPYDDDSFDEEDDDDAGGELVGAGVLLAGGGGHDPEDGCAAGAPAMSPFSTGAAAVAGAPLTTAAATNGGGGRPSLRFISLRGGNTRHRMPLAGAYLQGQAAAGDAAFAQHAAGAAAGGSSYTPAGGAAGSVPGMGSDEALPNVLALILTPQPAAWAEPPAAASHPHHTSSAGGVHSALQSAAQDAAIGSGEATPEHTGPTAAMAAAALREERDGDGRPTRSSNGTVCLQPPAAMAAAAVAMPTSPQSQSLLVRAVSYFRERASGAVPHSTVSGSRPHTLTMTATGAIAAMDAAAAGAAGPGAGAAASHATGTGTASSAADSSAHRQQHAARAAAQAAGGRQSGAVTPSTFAALEDAADRTLQPPRSPALLQYGRRSLNFALVPDPNPDMAKLPREELLLLPARGAAGGGGGSGGGPASQLIADMAEAEAETEAGLAVGADVMQPDLATLPAAAPPSARASGTGSHRPSDGYCHSTAAASVTAAAAGLTATGGRPMTASSSFVISSAAVALHVDGAGQRSRRGSAAALLPSSPQASRLWGRGSGMGVQSVAGEAAGTQQAGQAQQALRAPSESADATALRAPGGGGAAAGGGGGGGTAALEPAAVQPSASSITALSRLMGDSRRRPPRKVASAIGHLGRRRSSMVSAAEAAVLPAAGGSTLATGHGMGVTAVEGGRSSGAGAGAGAKVAAAVAGFARSPSQLVLLKSRSSRRASAVLPAGVGGGGERLSNAGVAGAGGAGRRSIGPASGLAAAVASKMLSMPPPPPVVEEVERQLAKAEGWHFNAFQLRDVTGGFPLSALAYFLMHRAGLVAALDLRPHVLARALRYLEAGYVDNPYHSATHAADVLQTLHVIIHGAQLNVHYLDPLGLFAAYWAAIVHDYRHPGLTNDFLVATGHPLAIRYNDRSPLENHHVAASFAALRRPELDVLAALPPEARVAFRKQVIDMVLATDMKQHFALLSQFNTVHRLANFSAQQQALQHAGGGAAAGNVASGGAAAATGAGGGGAGTASGANLLPRGSATPLRLLGSGAMARQGAAALEAAVRSPRTLLSQRSGSGTPATDRPRSDLATSAHPSDVLVTIGDGVGHATAAAATAAGGGMEPASPRVETAPRPIDDTERLLSLQIAIKVADLGHLGEELEVHKRWLAGLEEEFFRQGDKEKQLGIPISPLFDRSKQGVSKSQVGFYDFVALPLVHALSGAFPGTQPIMKCFLRNYQFWRMQEPPPPPAAGQQS
ncbi:hypothetical protein HXX76_005823 [Chlamydomonas incerta]|nr:hypothetical protein HXX76_005823 [Chlamydomonas incerta]|eukprot:KAG2437156.1 hypothetical protein HXX76_005823 [Chlamydomonas incerta]